MTAFPIALDSLIAYVHALHPEGGALDRLSEAVSVSDRLNDQADSLIGHFVDQARRSGASWSEIGASMGVSKQAAQKRFVPRWDDTSFESGRLFSRFTPRAWNTLLAAQALARTQGEDEIDVGHLLLGLLSEPHAIAAYGDARGGHHRRAAQGRARRDGGHPRRRASARHRLRSVDLHR